MGAGAGTAPLRTVQPCDWLSCCRDLKVGGQWIPMGTLWDWLSHWDLYCGRKPLP